MRPIARRGESEGDPMEAGDAVAAVVCADESSLVRVCGLTLLERNLRALSRAGQRQATVVSASARVLEEAARPHWSRASFAVRTVLRPAGAPALRLSELAELAGHRPVLYAPGGVLCETRLFEALLAARESTVLVDSAPPRKLHALTAAAPQTGRGLVCGPCRLEPAFLNAHPDAPLEEVLPAAVENGDVRPLDVAAQPAYLGSLRRTLRPLWFRAPRPEHARAAEEALLDTAQKGALDIPAMVHAPIETAIVARLCSASVTPNQLTVAAAAVAWIATLLFAGGHLAAGLAVALAVGVLDGLDGKLARLKLETSRVGELEHVSDFVFELSWWSALAWHFFATGALPGAFLALLALYGAEAMDALVKLAAIKRLGVLIDEAAPSMRLVRWVGGRRNIYTWIMAVGWCAGHPAAAFVLLPAWEAATAALHVAWALANADRFRGVAAPALAVEGS
jgi:phosphatidylglycerophosphate synthase